MNLSSSIICIDESNALSGKGMSGYRHQKQTSNCQVKLFSLSSEQSVSKQVCQDV